MESFENRYEGLLTHNDDYWKGLAVKVGFKGEHDCFSFMLNEYDKIIIHKEYDNTWSAYYCYWNISRDYLLFPAEYSIQKRARLRDCVRDSLLWLEDYEHIQLRRAWREQGKPITPNQTMDRWEPLRESHGNR